MKKTLLTLAVIVLASASSVSASEPQRRASSDAASISGATTEVRYVSNPSNRRGTKVSKLIITRDATGRIISVKRG